jgi:hypothetical protein
MKNLAIVTAIMATIATASFASGPVAYTDVSAEVLPVSYSRGIELTFGLTENYVETLGVSYEALSYSVGSVENTFDLMLGYNRVTDLVTVGAEYTSAAEITSGASGYGAVLVDYAAPATTLSGGSFFVTPHMGLTYDVASSVELYTEVGYTFNASTDFSRVGGYAQLGADFAVTDYFSVRPSVTRTFDTAADDTTARVDAVFRF